MSKRTDGMDKDELQAELKEAKARVREVEKALGEYDSRRKEQARAELQKKASELGFTVEELVGQSRRRGAPARRGAPKYRHPENPQNTWTGKGRQPAWYREHMERGGKPEDLAV